MIYIKDYLVGNLVNQLTFEYSTVTLDIDDGESIQVYTGNIFKRIRLDKDNNITTEEYDYDIMNNLKNYKCSGALCTKDSLGNIIIEEDYTFDLYNNIKLLVN